MVRTFRRDDQGVVEGLIQAGMTERWGPRYDPTANPDVADLWASYVESGAYVVVAEVDGAIVATGILLALDDATGRIRRMSVDAAHRRRGLAREIVHDLLIRARRRALTRVLVRTDTPWTDAVALYRSCGFEVEAQDAVQTDLALDLVATDAR